MDGVRSIQHYSPTLEEIHAIFKRLCNDNQSTAGLKVGTHCTYFEDIQKYMIEKHEYELQMPVSPRDYY